MARQLELLPLRMRTAAQRKAWISQRLHGFKFRQAARNERRRLERKRRNAETEEPAELQRTIAELL